MKSIEECETLLERVGLATILPSKDALLPCLLWEARGHRDHLKVWDEALGRVWTWKDDMPARKTAWLGRLFGDRVVLLHRRLVPTFLQWRGRPGPAQLYQQGHLTREAFGVWSAMHNTDEPWIGRAPLRRVCGLSSKEDAGRFDRACRDLERLMLLTRAGRSPVPSGWDSNAYALVERWFPEQWEGSATWSQPDARTAVREALEHAAPKATPRQITRWMRDP